MTMFPRYVHTPVPNSVTYVEGLRQGRTVLPARAAERLMNVYNLSELQESDAAVFPREA